MRPTITPNVVLDIAEDATLTYKVNNALNALMDTTLDIQIAYYANQADAQSEQNPLNTNYVYSVANNTVFARANYTGSACFTIQPFVLAVNPTPNLGTLLDLQNCDDDFDTFSIFDLSQQTPFALAGQNPSDFSVSYFTTQNDAINNTNALTDLLVDSENNTLYYVRIENNATGCFNTTSFATIVSRKPEVDIEDQVLCLENLPLIVTAETNIPTDSYSWSTSSSLSYIEITEIGTYSVTVTSQFGCTSTADFSRADS